MSPEQCRDSSHVDARSDLYSLGCIFFEMVCGRHPFKAPTIGELFAAHLRDPVPSPRSIDPRISPLYEGVILKLLAKSPEQRYQSAKQLVAELAGTKRTTARLQLDPEPDSEPVLPEAPLSTTLASTASEVTRAEGVGRRRTIVAAATLAAVVTLGVAWRTHQEPVAVVQVPEVASPPRPDPIVTKLIRRRFLTNPGGAQVVRRGDNSLVCITPCEESVAYGDDRRAFVLRLDGYKDESTVLSRYDDATVELQLQLLPASSGKSPVATPPAQGPRSPPPPADKRVKLPVLPEMKTPKTEATPSGAEEPPARSRAPAKGTEEDADGVVNPFRR